MPNWVRNELRIVPNNWMCPDVEIEEVLDALKETIENYKERVRIWIEENRKASKGHHPGWSKPSGRSIFDFENIIPYPEEFKQRDKDAATLTPEEFKAKYPTNTDKVFGGERNKDGPPLDGFNNGGYQWCIQNWGTKWGACNPVWVDKHHTLHFDTAWGPVFPIISALHKRFPHLTLQYEYYERGMGFMGGCEYVRESWWTEDMVPMGKEHEFEMSMKKDGYPPLDFKWEAGQAYDHWTQDYKGYKGG